MTVFGTYHLPPQTGLYYFDNLDKTFDTFIDCKKRFLIVRFNTKSRIDSFVYEHEIDSLVNEETFFKRLFIWGVRLDKKREGAIPECCVCMKLGCFSSRSDKAGP